MGAYPTSRQIADPPGVEVAGADGAWRARFTQGARAVTLSGPARSFAERGVSVTHGVWVRCLSEPFAGVVDAGWLADASEANEQGEPDLLAIATEYVRGAPPRCAPDPLAALAQPPPGLSAGCGAGELQIGGDAGYGPIVGGAMQEGADFNDYLGVPWAYPGEAPAADPPEARQFRCLDCSGLIRMVWGFRRHAPHAGPRGAVPLSRDVRPGCLPRRAWQIAAHGPGVMVLADNGARPADLSGLAAGDLVFFDADDGDGTRIDHVGIYLGTDAAGRRRFLSSRKGASAPTLADWQSPSVLDGEGHYAGALRAARRL